MTGGPSASHDMAAAALGWLVAAGVDTVVGDDPFAWLAPAGEIIAPSPVAHAAAPQPAATAEQAALSVDSLAALAAALVEAHPTAVAAAGTPGPVMVIGDRPSAADAAAGHVFADDAGALLDRMLAAIGRSRGDTYLASAVPWPGGPATPAEIAAAAPFVRRQIALAKPQFIVALGQVAAAALTGSATGIVRLRGQWHEIDGIPVMPTFSPAHLLRRPADKKLAWADLCAVRDRLAE